MLPKKRKASLKYLVKCFIYNEKGGARGAMRREIFSSSREIRGSKRFAETEFGGRGLSAKLYFSVGDFQTNCVSFVFPKPSVTEKFLTEFLCGKSGNCGRFANAAFPFWKKSKARFSNCFSSSEFVFSRFLLKSSSEKDVFSISSAQIFSSGFCQTSFF
jgi:hypothetical protein